MLGPGVVVILFNWFKSSPRLMQCILVQDTAASGQAYYWVLVNRPFPLASVSIQVLVQNLSSENEFNLNEN